MYIIKNALKCIFRAKGRNILIGIIVLVIASSSCIGLSIRQAAENAKDEALRNLSITASITLNRQSMMKDMKGSGEESSEGGFDRGKFKDMMGNVSSLTLEEYQTYAKASSVKDFYYTLTAAFNGSDSFEPVSVTDDDLALSDDQNFLGNKGGFSQIQSDFQVIGYSSESAMTDFIDGNSSITEGVIFEEQTENYDCIISDELAAYNDLNVKDTIILTNPNQEGETYTLTITGIYTNTSANENFLSNLGMTSSDPANQIYMSYNALQDIIDRSSASAVTQSDDNGMVTTTAIIGTLNGTYVLGDLEAYEAFQEEVYTLGLDESYSVTSSDITSYENSLLPLTTLSTMAGWYLVVILIIGAIILVVLNIFNIRERKYEIGVLTAIGMKKVHVALQFITEAFVVTMIAVVVGIGIGAASSVPVTNALLENQIASQSQQYNRVEQNFGRGDMANDDRNGTMDGSMKGNAMQNFMGNTAEYITEINSAMNFTVVLQMFAIAVLLTLVSGSVSILFVMRYEPLKILANRD